MNGEGKIHRYLWINFLTVFFKYFFFSKPRRPDNLGSASTIDAQKKFGSAKAISSDMFFGAETNVSSLGLKLNTVGIQLPDVSGN